MLMPMAAQDKIPYPFILEYLNGVDITVKPMFGGYAVYSDGKLQLFLLRRAGKPNYEKGLTENGIYAAGTADHIDSLRSEFPDAEFQLLKGGKVWIFFAESSEMFEPYTAAACEMIAARDPRLGR